jgi:hypothetical protein
VRFVGSIYIAVDTSDELEKTMTELLFSENVRRDGPYVQALMVAAIGTHMSGNTERAASLINNAIDVALEIGMNRREFALENSNGNPLHVEMWRRTWWELYVVDAMISASVERPTFRLQYATSNVLLPCEEAEYRSGVSSTTADEERWY